MQVAAARLLEAFDEEILDIGHGVGHTPRHARIVTHMREARPASGNASADDIAALEEDIDRNEAAFREEDWDAASGCNQEFHFKIVNIARMEILGGMLSALWLQTGPVVSSFYQRGGRSMVDEHYAIVAAIKAGDADAAARVMKRDVAGSVEGIVAYLRELAQ